MLYLCLRTVYSGSERPQLPQNSIKVVLAVLFPLNLCSAAAARRDPRCSRLASPLSLPAYPGSPRASRPRLLPLQTRLGSLHTRLGSLQSPRRNPSSPRWNLRCLCRHPFIPSGTPPSLPGYPHPRRITLFLPGSRYPRRDTSMPAGSLPGSHDFHPSRPDTAARENPHLPLKVGIRDLPPKALRSWKNHPGRDLGLAGAAHPCLCRDSIPVFPRAVEKGQSFLFSTPPASSPSIPFSPLFPTTCCFSHAAPATPRCCFPN